MLSGFLDAASRKLSLLAPETAHEATLKALEFGLFPRASVPDHPCLALSFAGLTLPNPVGIAAGFDKDARVPDAVLGLGCGFAEIGTMTPRAQAGNPQPRVFRLPRDRAVINRLGFNNGGIAPRSSACADGRYAASSASISAPTRTPSDRIADYVDGIDAFFDVASYFTVNISSPNTPGLRDLQTPEALDALLGASCRRGRSSSRRASAASLSS